MTTREPEGLARPLIARRCLIVVVKRGIQMQHLPTVQQSTGCHFSQTNAPKSAQTSTLCGSVGAASHKVAEDSRLLVVYEAHPAWSREEFGEIPNRALAVFKYFTSVDKMWHCEVPCSHGVFLRYFFAIVSPARGSTQRCMPS